eukprot:SAG11_NODE_3416_length_2461_cov_24.168925_2_plen_58_part_00
MLDLPTLAHSFRMPDMGISEPGPESGCLRAVVDSGFVYGGPGVNLLCRPCDVITNEA